MLRQEAAEAVAKLQTRKYRRAVRDSRPCCSSSACSKQHGKQKRESELCAVCLDEFYNNQVSVPACVTVLLGDCLVKDPEEVNQTEKMCISAT